LDEETTQLNTTLVTENIKDLIVHLHRGNGPRAETIITDVAGKLNKIILSGQDPASSSMQRAQQTMFAIDEVRILLGQKDFNGAVDAARDAGKEWKQKA
jgi:hypothetical protein